MRVNRWTLATSLATAFAILSAPVQASVVVPYGTTDYDFSWVGGTGQIDDIKLHTGATWLDDTIWQLNLGATSNVTFSVWDPALKSDEFKPLVALSPGALVQTDWTQITTGPDGHFSAFYTLLGAGIYLFSLDVTQLSMTGNRENQDGNARATFSVSEVSPVPLPATLPLLAAGIGGLALIGRRRKTA